MAIEERSGARGLSAREAAARLRAEGANELPRGHERSLAAIAAEVAREPMFALLLGAGLLYLVIGDLGDALVLLAFATISIVIAIVQETRSERVLSSLRDLTSPRALVIRDGARQRIPGRDVVRGDLVVVGEGDRVPADAVLLTAQDVAADESLLTGESLPVRKLAGAASAPAARPGGDDLPVVFSGTMVVRGQGVAEVIATGAGSEIGKIGRALGTIETEPPVLRRQTDRLVRLLATVGLGLCTVVVLLHGLVRGDWLAGLLGGIALGMSLLPEEFPLVLTVFMVMGAWRISQARVLTRRAAAIETLGAATVLCTDKTGTLTQNRMTAAELSAAGRTFRVAGANPAGLPEEFRLLVEYAILASPREAVDPMERAIHALADAVPHPDWTLAHAYGLRPELLAMAQLWRRAEAGASYVVAAKGAPEAIAALSRLDGESLARMREAADDMASRGMRVLGVARAAFAGPEFPANLRAFDCELLGLVGFADPLRPSAAAAVSECRAAGIRVLMVTGDYPTTARAIAAEAGLAAETAVTGEEIAALGDAGLADKVRAATIFARIMPEQKLRIVEALKKSGEIVAMTGDGVNDAPSLRAAHIGIAMGGRGTDVAREAAAIVLLDDDFGSIVRTIRLGRRIYDNLKKAMGYILAVHVPIAGLALLPLVSGLPLILLPVHIAIIEMVIDPVCSIVFEAEPEESDVMARRPRDAKNPLLSPALAGWGLFQGAFVLAVVAAIYLAAVARGAGEDEVRALTFLSLLAANIGLIFSNRSFGASLGAALSRPNAALWWAVGATAVAAAVMLWWRPAGALLHFAPLDARELAVCGGAGLLTLLVPSLVKLLCRRRLAA
ncbi:MAG TPA: cation-translocating P-type ATPase [Stellaceae bacterium]|nr:cation-translocating P-type ATPase [Stellaceae bacterium]